MLIDLILTFIYFSHIEFLGNRVYYLFVHCILVCIYYRWIFWILNYACPLLPKRSSKTQIWRILSSFELRVICFCILCGSHIIQALLYYYFRLHIYYFLIYLFLLNYFIILIVNWLFYSLILILNKVYLLFLILCGSKVFFFNLIFGTWK